MSKIAITVPPRKPVAPAEPRRCNRARASSLNALPSAAGESAGSARSALTLAPAHRRPGRFGCGGAEGIVGAPHRSSGGSPANRSQPARGPARASQPASPRPARAPSSHRHLAALHDRNDLVGQAGPVLAFPAPALSRGGPRLLVAVGGHRPPSFAGAVTGRRRFAASARRTSRAATRPASLTAAPDSREEQDLASALDPTATAPSAGHRWAGSIPTTRGEPVACGVPHRDTRREAAPAFTAPRLPACRRAGLADPRMRACAHPS